MQREVKFIYSTRYNKVQFFVAGKRNYCSLIFFVGTYEKNININKNKNKTKQQKGRKKSHFENLTTLNVMYVSSDIKVVFEII